MGGEGWGLWRRCGEGGGNVGRDNTRVVVMARVRKHRQAQWQARQAKSKKQNRYVIKVMRLNTEDGRECGSLGLREPKDAPNQRMHGASCDHIS